MPKPIEKYSQYELGSNVSFAVTLLRGYLKDVVSEQKVLEIAQKLSLPSSIIGGAADDMERQYGKNNYYMAAYRANRQEVALTDDSENRPGARLWQQNGSGLHYTDPNLEEAFEVYDDGMRELLEILDENESKIPLSDPNARNHYLFVKGILQDSYDGTLGSKMSEDPTYATSVGLTAKIGFETGPYEYDFTKNKYHIKIDGVDTRTVLKETKDTGLLEGMAGGFRVHQKMKDNIATGNTSRQEIIYECDAQSKRYDKIMKLTMDQVEALRKKSVLQNKLSEYTDGPRGILVGVDDTNAKKDLLNCGYPMEDLAAMSAFYVQMKVSQRAIKRLQGEVDKNPTGPEAAGKRESIDRLKEITQNMERVWGAAIDPKNGPLTQEKRLNNLNAMNVAAKNALDALKGKGDFPYALNQFAERMNARINAQLSIGDRALLSSNYTEMYNALNDADPTILFTSSKQFRDLKKAVKELAQMEQGLDAEQKKTSAQFKAKQREVLEKSQNYLRYKDKQMNGPDGRNHKRSALELSRVQAVDGVYNKILADMKRDDPQISLKASEMALVPGADRKDLLTKQSGEARDYDSYLKLHSGKLAMSGTKEELVMNLARVYTAILMSKMEPPVPFDLKKIERKAAMIRDSFNLAELDEKKIIDALQHPETMKNVTGELCKKTYHVDKDKMKEYIQGMRMLYKDMYMPDDVNDNEYATIFEKIKMIAHLPSDPEKAGLPMEKVTKLVEKFNTEIFEQTDRYVDYYGSGMGPNDPRILQVMSDMSRLLPSAKGRIDRIVKRVCEMQNEPEIDLADYGRDKQADQRLKSDRKLKLFPNARNNVIKELKLTENEEKKYNAIMEEKKKQKKEERKKEEKHM